MQVSRIDGRLPEPEAHELARSRALLERVRTRIAAAGGWIPFDEYMRMALYEPGLGYYDAAGAKFGSAGDFTTAPEISPLFARALAAQVHQAFGETAPCILEFGAGTGVLARELLDELARRGCSGAQYRILEVSADLAARQREALSGRPVQWLDRLPQSFSGVVIANEVLDVLPVRLFLREGGTLHERGVRADGVELAWENRPADGGLVQIVQDIESTVGPLADGYGAEACPMAAAWLTAVAGAMDRGLVLVCDYGFPRREYYHPQRAMGTLMCHYRQHAHADPLWLPGLNDITSHIDFSACALAAAGAGLDVLGYAAQANFLMNCGILELLREDFSAARSAAVQRLLSEAEMGELVKVMALGRGMEAELIGFSRADRRHRL
jgi:SAM-dependent MidA family methyltransferase